MSRFFIERPVFAAVIAIVIVILGAVAAPTLPVAQYPNITPPLVQVTANYPGATGQVVSDIVATPVEQQVNGVDQMIYMESFCTADGAMTLNVTFDVGTDPNIDQVLTQNRVAMALPQMPSVVQKTGVITQKSNPSILLVINLYSPDNRYDASFISNYFKTQIYDEILRVKGVGQLNIGGVRDYAMRLWLDPAKLDARGISALQVVEAVKNQNVDVAAGRLGAPPNPKPVETVLLLSTKGRLNTEQDFADIVVATSPQGDIIRVRDVGRVELGAQTYVQNGYLDGSPAIVGACFAQPGTNALVVADGIKQKMEELKQKFPPGLDYATYYDTTLFIQESAAEVVWTLIESSFLVSLVIFVFLQSWRSAIIPIISLPVSIIGAFAMMAVFGFSFNNLSLFGLVLAIGIVVDDAIVVVENIEKKLEEGLSPKQASLKAMEEISGAVFAVTLVLCCVFIPAAFITGITGQFYRQFALTIAASTMISGINSLTLSPALAAILLKPREHGHSVPKASDILPLGIHAAAFGLIGAAIGTSIFGHVPFQPNPLRTLAEGFIYETPHDATITAAIVGLIVGAAVGIPLGAILNRALIVFFRGFNSAFDICTRIYGKIVSGLLRVAVLGMVVYGVLLWGTFAALISIPVGFVPQMDKGYVIVSIVLPDGASLERTDAIVKQVSKIMLEIPGVAHTVSWAGYNMVAGANSTSAGTVIGTLAPFEERMKPELRADHILREIRPRVAGIREAIIVPFGAPPIDGLGKSGGFKGQIQDRGNLGPIELDKAARQLIRAGMAQPQIAGLQTTYSARLPQLYLDIDRTQASQRGVDLSDIFQTLQVYVGSLYINDMNLDGRTWQVQAQAESAYRLNQQDIDRINIRNKDGEMVPFGALVKHYEITGPEKVSRYNMYRSADIMGIPKEGTSSGQIIELMDALAKKVLPSSMTFEWTDLYYQQIKAGNTSVYVFIFATLMVFLVLSAQYESFRLPISVILIVPMCILCAIGGVAYRHFDNNIFTQVGLIVLVGLACKNAILIVEFAKQRREEGVSAHEATVEAAVARLRPILMTSFCFIHMVPLYFAQGAGAEMRQSLGTAVLFGAFGVTAFGIFFTPIFFYVIDRFISPKPKSEESAPAPDTSIEHHG